VTVTAVVPRYTRCEHCGTGFVYELARAPEDADGSFLDADRIAGATTGECRICLKVFNTHRPSNREQDADPV
jgi:hypothetical protein